MADEESFVILGTSPTSMESFISINKNDMMKATKEESSLLSSLQTDGVATIENEIVDLSSSSTVQKNHENQLKDLVASTNNSDEVFSLITHSTVINNDNEVEKTSNDEISSAAISSSSSVKASTYVDTTITKPEISTDGNGNTSQKQETATTETAMKVEMAPAAICNGTTAMASNTNVGNTDIVLSATEANQQSSDYSVPFESLKEPSMNASPSSSSHTYNKTTLNDHIQNYQSSDPRADSRNTSFAASFILGDIETGFNKENSVFTHFPSLSGAEIHNNDIAKLEQYVNEHNVLKETMQFTNMELQKNFALLSELQNEIQEHKKESADVIANLRNENAVLRRELLEKLEFIKLTDELMKEENDELRKPVSEKRSIISNMREHFKKSGQDKCSSFDIIHKANDNNVDEQNSKLSSVDDFMQSIPEHKKLMKEIEKKLSEITLENLELKNKQQIYIDEIDCLKKILQATEESLKEAKADINSLKCTNLQRIDLFEKYERDNNDMKHEIEVLRVQLEIYRKDFEMERKSREQLAGEKDQLLSDLKMLQRRNQKLIEETRMSFEKETKKQNYGQTGAIPSTSKQSSSNQQKGAKSSDPFGKEEKEYNGPSTIYACPLCDKDFDSLDILQAHVQDCISSLD